MKPNRAGWNEGQYDPDRLSHSLAAYALVGQCELDDTTAAGTITDGSDDGAIDALYFDRVGNRLVLVQSADVIGRPQLELTPADQTSLSQLTNQLAELIYAVSEPLQAFKGYLAIFRNLTDAQPLANSVLQRLAEQDAQQHALPKAPASPQA